MTWNHQLILITGISETHGKKRSLKYIAINIDMINKYGEREKRKQNMHATLKE